MVYQNTACTVGSKWSLVHYATHLCFPQFFTLLSMCLCHQRTVYCKLLNICLLWIWCLQRFKQVGTGVTKHWERSGTLQKHLIGTSILEGLICSQARVGARFTTLLNTQLYKEYYCTSWEYFIKLLSVNAVCLQMTEFCFYLCITQQPSFVGIWDLYPSHIKRQIKVVDHDIFTYLRPCTQLGWLDWRGKMTWIRSSGRTGWRTCPGNS